MDRQKEVIKAFKEPGEVLTKKEIMERARLYYYHNSAKHAGDVLTRMVRNGSLVRVSQGRYKLSKLGKRPPGLIPPDPNQLNLSL